jgi:PAT family beta-lactamase induction signal transducer AmpG
MGLSNATFGLVGGFIVLPLPQLLAAEGVSEAKIAAVSAACLSPGFWVFLLGPLLDLKFSRRFYAGLFAVLAGSGLAFAVVMKANLAVLEVSVMISYAAAVLSSNALGGWLGAILPQVADDDRDESNHEAVKLGAWTQVGSFLGGGAIAVLAGEFSRLFPVNAAAVLLGLLVMLPAAVFPWIPLPVEGDGVRRRTAVESFAELFRDLKQLLTRREVWWMMALFLAPTGSFALTNQLGGVARDFHASEAFVSRMGGAVLSFAGATVCLLLPIFAKWVKPLPLYLTIGTVGSLFTLGLLLLPRTPAAFAVAFMAENVVQALSFTSAVAICLSTIGKDNPLAATQFTLLTSATVLPILYMGVLDGRAYAGLAGVSGLNGMYLWDGCLSLVACVVMGLAMWCWPGAVEVEESAVRAPHEYPPIA